MLKLVKTNITYKEALQYLLDGEANVLQHIGTDGYGRFTLTPDKKWLCNVVDIICWNLDRFMERKTTDWEVYKAVGGGGTIYSIWEFSRDTNSTTGFMSTNRPSTDALSALESWRVSDGGRTYNVLTDNDDKLVVELYVELNDWDLKAGKDLDRECRKCGVVRQPKESTEEGEPKLTSQNKEQ